MASKVESTHYLSIIHSLHYEMHLIVCLLRALVYDLLMHLMSFCKFKFAPFCPAKKAIATSDLRQFSPFVTRIWLRVIKHKLTLLTKVIWSLILRYADGCFVNGSFATETAFSLQFLNTCWCDKVDTFLFATGWIYSCVSSAFNNWAMNLDNDTRHFFRWAMRKSRPWRMLVNLSFFVLTQRDY